ncbi:MAG: ATP-binding protein [Myxococcales bacterium]|nr:ATP-binding protein [Myxococcales bacterium]
MSAAKTSAPAPAARASPWLDALVEPLLPLDLADDPIERRRARLAVVYSIASLSMLALFSLLAMLLLPEPWVALLGVTVIAAEVGITTAYKRTGAMELLGMVRAAAPALAIPVAAAYTGGILSPALLWMLLPPMLASTFLSPRAGVGFGLWSLACVLGFAGLELVGIRLSSPLGGASLVIVTAACLVLLSLLLWMLARLTAGEQRHANRMLVESLADARGAAQAKGQFLADMSHELRTPMSSVIGFADLLSGTKLDDAQRDYVATIVRSGESMVALVNDILDLSKIEAGMLQIQREPFNLADCVEAASHGLASMAERKGLDNRVRCPAALERYFVGDEIRVRQVLTNLIGNALKFTREGHVETSATIERRERGRMWVRFEVRDTGIGIPGNRLESIFEAFTQAEGSTTRDYGGTGLGLTISTRLVHMLDGEIGVESEEGKGSTFWFRLPMTPTAPPHEVQQAQTFDAPIRSGMRPRVLLAEDDHTNRRFIQMTLNRLGCDVDLAADGQEAVSLAGDNPYALIFMDLQMPTLDGFDATRTIRDMPGAAGRTPIVAVTAHVMPGVREKCIEAGMNGFLPKPVSFAALREILDECLEMELPTQLENGPPAETAS